MNITDQEIKQCEDYLKETTNCKIVQSFGKYIILAHDELDLKSKQSKIARGETLGYYVIERVLKIVKSKESC